MATYIRTIGITLVLALLANSAFAEIIVQYSVTGDSFNTTTNAVGVAGSTLTNASLGTFETRSFSYSTDPEIKVIPPVSTTTASLAVANNSYFSFTVTPTLKEMDFSSLTFKVARGGSSTPRGWVVRSSIDSYTNNIDSGDVPTVRPTWTDESVSLSGASYQNITAAVTFRIYIYAPSTGYSLEIDEITLNGTVSDVSGGGSLSSDTFEDSAPVLTRWVQIERKGTDLWATLYSDANYSVSLDSVYVPTVVDTYRYLSVFPTWNSGVTGTSFSGSLWNLNLNVQTGATCNDVCSLCANSTTCSASPATCYWWTTNECKSYTQPTGTPALQSITITGQNLTVSFP